ncbi:MAG: hypothetical protein MIO93_05975 [ANME-2 cluster archaeon]|nr:hypothetical protein [ANME-2 cluster archaeon]
MSEGQLEGNLGDDPYAHVGDPDADPILRPVLNANHFKAVADKGLLNLLNDPVDMPLTEEDLIFATSFLAASADKTGEITVDMVFYTNSIIALNTKNTDGFYDQTTVVDFSGFYVDRHPRYDKSVYVLVPELHGNGAWVRQHWVEEWLELMN